MCFQSPVSDLLYHTSTLAVEQGQRSCAPGQTSHSRPFLAERIHWSQSFFFFLDFIYLFLERGAGREKERERHINVWLPLMHPLLGTWPVTQACAPTGTQTSDLVLRLSLIPLSYTARAHWSQSCWIQSGWSWT